LSLRPGLRSGLWLRWAVPVPRVETGWTATRTPWHDDGMLANRRFFYGYGPGSLAIVGC